MTTFGYIPKLSDIRLIPSNLLTLETQVRFPKSKKRRIRKKWTKRLTNWGEVPSPSAFMLEPWVYAVHPKMMDRMIRALERTSHDLDAWRYLFPGTPI